MGEGRQSECRYQRRGHGVVEARDERYCRQDNHGHRLHELGERCCHAVSRSTLLGDTLQRRCERGERLWQRGAGRHYGLARWIVCLSVCVRDKQRHAQSDDVHGNRSDVAHRARRGRQLGRQRLLVFSRERGKDDVRRNGHARMVADRWHRRVDRVRAPDRCVRKCGGKLDGLGGWYCVI